MTGGWFVPRLLALLASTDWLVTAALFPLVCVYVRHIVHRFQWQRRKDAQIALRNDRATEDAYWSFRAREYLSALAVRRERLGLRLVNTDTPNVLWPVGGWNPGSIPDVLADNDRHSVKVDRGQS